MNILICLNDDYLKIRINRLLSKDNYQYKITDKPIRQDDLVNYDLVLIHSTYRIDNLYGFIENAVLKKLSTILYITTNTNSNPFRKFIDHPNIMFIDEHKLDIELPFAINMHKKYVAQISKLDKDYKKLSNNLENINLMNKCKRMLMQKGLSENESHKHILKYAMDNHIDKYEACNRLLNDE